MKRYRCRGSQAPEPSIDSHLRTAICRSLIQRVLQSQNLANFPYRRSPGRHRTSLCIGAKEVACAIRLPVGHEPVTESLNRAMLSLNH
jgi:hypothetical protein